jgi:DNA-directed RNA polymerase specialized sigma24 family protein
VKNLLAVMANSRDGPGINKQMTTDTPTYAGCHHAVFVLPMERTYSLAEIVSELDWEAWTRRWTAYARKRQCRHGSAAARFLSQPGDCVQDAIHLILEGRRRFESGTLTAFFAFVCGVIDSLISHEASRARRYRAVALVGDTDEPMPGEIFEGMLVAPGSSESELLFLDDLEEFIKTLEIDLATYARLRACDSYSPSEEYAEALSVPVSEIRNMDRRLRRRRIQWSQQAGCAATQ